MVTIYFGEQIERGQECQQEDSLIESCKGFWWEIVVALTRMFCRRDGIICVD